MQRYYFDFEDGVSTIDEQGTELPGIEVAKREACLALGDLTKDFMQRECGAGRLVVRIRDDNGPVLEIAATIEATPLAPR